MTAERNVAECRIESLDDLKDFVAATLCGHEQLEPSLFPVTQRLLHRGGRPCGIQFCLHGPRAVKLVAIWESKDNSVLFYDSAGERFQRVQLTQFVQQPAAAFDAGAGRQAA